MPCFVKRPVDMRRGGNREIAAEWQIKTAPKNLDSYTQGAFNPFLGEVHSSQRQDFDLVVRRSL
jgi:hypothetical protein